MQRCRGANMNYPKRFFSRYFLGLELCVSGLLLCVAGEAWAQQPAVGSVNQPLLDASQTQQEQSTGGTTGTTTKFVGYITNRSLVFPDIATNPAPPTTGGKFKLFVNQSISPPYILAAGISAGYSQARNIPPEYGQGWGAFGERFGDDMARGASNSFFGTFVLASLLHQNPRFYPQYKPSFWSSVKYSAQRLVVTRDDAGRDVFNASGVFGTLAAEALANAYLPASEQTAGKSLERVGTDLAWRFAGNMLENKWPAIFHKLGFKRLEVIPAPAAAPKTPE
jgi:hypothetical protein